MSKHFGTTHIRTVRRVEPEREYLAVYVDGELLDRPIHGTHAEVEVRFEGILAGFHDFSEDPVECFRYLLKDPATSFRHTFSGYAADDLRPE